MSGIEIPIGAAATTKDEALVTDHDPTGAGASAERADRVASEALSPNGVPSRESAGLRPVGTPPEDALRLPADQAFARGPIAEVRPGDTAPTDIGYHPTVSVRVAALAQVVLCSGLPTQLVLAGLLALAGVGAFDASGRLSTSYVAVVSLLDTVVILGLVVWFLRLHGERWRTVLVGPRRVWREIVLGVVHVPLTFLIVVAVMLSVRQWFPWLHNVPRNPFEGIIRGPLDAWLFGVVAVVGGGLREEVQRAFILHRFERYLGGRLVGLLLSSALFGLGHVIQGRDVALATAALGLFWGVVYLRRRSIGATVTSHSGFNAAEIIRYTLWGA